MDDGIFLDGYTGQSTDELIALESTHRADSLVLAFEQASRPSGLGSVMSF